MILFLTVILAIVVNITEQEELSACKATCISKFNECSDTKLEKFSKRVVDCELDRKKCERKCIAEEKYKEAEAKCKAKLAECLTSVHSKEHSNKGCTNNFLTCLSVASQAEETYEFSDILYED